MKKLAVVIGAGPGLGFSVARKFASEGFASVLVARNEDNLKKMCASMIESGMSSAYKVCDCSDPESLIRVIREIKAEYGCPDCVVYNAGITAPDTPELSADDLVAHFKTDVAGAYTVVGEVADSDFAEKKGAVIFTGGGLAMYPAEGFVPLSIDKAALRAMAYILNEQYKDKGIFVGTVTICGTINASPYLSADNIARKYWEMFVKRDKVEYAYQFPDLAPEILYAGKSPEYGLFERNASDYWGRVYQNIAEDNK